MPKAKKYSRILLLMLLCGSALFLLQCRGKDRREVQSPLDAALLIADGINDSQIQAEVLADISIKYADLGDFERSFEVIDDIPGGGFFSSEPAIGHPPIWQQVRALGNVAILLAKAKQQGRAHELLVQALVKAGTIRRPHLQGDALYQVSHSAAEAGELDQAIRIAVGIKDDFFQPRAFAEIADHLQLPEQFNRLLKTVDALADSYSRARTLIRLAEQAIKRGNTESVSVLLARAQETVLILEDNPITRNLLANLALQYALAGRKDRAREIFAQSLNRAKSIQDPSRRSLDMSQLTIMSAQAGDFQQALEIADQIGTGDARDQALVGVVGSLVETGLIDDAFDLTQRIRDNNHRSTAIERIVAVHVKQRQFQLALQLVRTISEEYTRAIALQKIAFGYAETADFEHSIEIALVITDARTQFYTLQKVALSLAAVDRNEQALKTVAMIRDPSYRARTMVGIARHYAGSRDSTMVAEIFDMAIKEVMTVQNRVDRANLLAEANIPWTRADLELNAERKQILNKLTESK